MKQKADLLNPKAKGRFRRLRRAAVQPAPALPKAADRLASPQSPTLRDLNRQALAQFIWRCKDGKTLPITEMRDAHLLNTMDMLTKQRRLALAEAVNLQTQDHDGSLKAGVAAARACQWLMVMEAELLRRHPHYLGDRAPLTPSGIERYALRDFDTAPLIPAGRL